MERFRDRRDAGRRLAAKLIHLQGRDPVVMALPRGGVPVGYEIASSLGAPLDVLLVRKLGVPGHEELAFGAIASGDLRVYNPDVVAATGLSEAQIEEVAGRETRELERRHEAYRAGEREQLEGRTVILVDDGIATGATMRVALDALKSVAGRTVVAVPVAPAQIVADLGAEADEFVALATPSDMRAIGLWYDDFSQTSDAEVRLLLERDDE